MLVATPLLVVRVCQKGKAERKKTRTALRAWCLCWPTLS